MNMARVGALGIALGAGLVAFYLVMNWAPESAPPGETTVAAPPAIKTTEVLVAAKDIPLGTSLNAGAVEWRAWPDDGIAQSYLTKKNKPNAPTELTGTIAKGSFFVGEPITEAKLAYTDRGFMSAILPAGKRAVATSISASTGAGGFILPNDRVDVIMTRRIAATNGVGATEERLVPETILTNVRVLAIDQTVRDENGKQVVVGQTATLELSPEQAEILTVAQRVNDKLTLSLRSLADAQESGGGASHLRDGGTTTSGVTVVRNGVAREVEVGR